MPSKRGMVLLALPKLILFRKRQFGKVVQPLYVASRQAGLLEFLLIENRLLPYVIQLLLEFCS